MKKTMIVAVIAALLLAFPVLPALALSAEGFTYELLPDGTVALTGFAGTWTATEITIPETLDGHAVSTIQGSEPQAFWSVALSELRIPAGITEIGDGAFAYCTGLERIFVSPENPSYAVIDDVLYDKTEKRLICYPAQKEDSSFEIPEGILSVADSAFRCAELRTVTIPDSVTAIGQGAFEFCRKLANVRISSEHPAFELIDGILYDRATGCLLLCPPSAGIEAVDIPEGTTAIAPYAFIGCEGLYHITIPDTVTSIGESAFKNCARLVSVRLPDSVTELGSSAFSGCLYMQTLELSSGLDTIAPNAFRSCAYLKELVVPEGITSIGAEAFSACSELIHVSLPESLRSVGARAFEDCRALADVVIPEGVEDFGYGAFPDCEALTLTVTRGSAAAEYAEKKGIRYIYTDTNDWLAS